ncbi:MAG TPA: heavy metal-associated domain-containing protein, partial [Gemmatimonadaceae bacterium]|nr:heavy metal-associated domain-containing protein [Gemmatimonadaceae bacterium]
MTSTTTPATPAAPASPAEQTPERVVIPVTGMTCAACQSRVQRTLARTPGVVDASVNLMMGNATVAYDPAAVDPGALVETIRATGYGAELPADDTTAFDEQTARDRATAEEFTDLRRKAVASGIAGAIAMVVSMPLMSRPAVDASGHAMQGATDPVMRWAMTSLDPALRSALPWLYAIPARVLAWTLLVITLA